MTENFIASNGIEIAWESEGSSRHLALDGGYVLQDGYEYDAIREYIIAEEDERLGRWRWPEKPNYVAYERHGSAAVLVAEEETGEAIVYYRDDLPEKPLSPSFVHAARAYFDAHPEPKLWHDAKPGEVWEIDFDGDLIAVTVSEDLFFERASSRGEYITFEHLGIHDGRRIWPADD